jgi:nicotinamide mononucleotide (NMN) deamidase PncC
VTVSAAETDFGSSIIQTLKLMEGSGQFFRGGVTVVSPEMAKELLSVPPSLWSGESAAGAPLAKALAEGVRRLAGSDLGIGIAGKVGKGKERDHVVHIALAHSGETDCIEQRWPSAMRFIENRMTKMALAQIKKYL